MSRAVEWCRDEIGCMYSQSCGNINVPEDSLSRLVEKRDQLQARIAELEGIVAKLVPSGEYMIATFKHGFVGNDVLFWGPNGGGYTCMLDEAGTYTRDEALKIHRDTAYDQMYMLPVEWVREHCHAVVEIQRAGGRDGIVKASREAALAAKGGRA